MSEPAILAQLHRDHKRLAQVLNMFEHQLFELESGAGADFELLRDILDYVQAFPDTAHHPAEDELFSYLLQSVDLSPDEKRRVLENRDQHAVLIEATRSLLRMVDDSFSGETIDRDALSSAMRSYLSQQRQHMNFENKHLFPLAEARLTDSDWIVLERSLALARDPLFDAYVAQFEILRHHIEATDELKAKA